MKKYNLSLLFAVATLMLGACQSPVKVEEVVNDGVEAKVEQDSPAEMEESKIKTTTYYDKTLFVLPLDHPYWETTSLSKENIQELKERYGFTDEGMATDDEAIAEEDSVSSVEKVNGKLDSEEEATTTNDNETSSTDSTSTSNTNSNATSTKPNSNSTTSNNTTKPNQNNQSSKPTPPVVEKPSAPAPQPTPPVVEQPSEPAPQPTPPVVEESKKPVDILDWNYIKSTLIAKGESLGMRYEDRATLEDGYESPWQSSYMTVTNEDVIGYIGTQMDRVANSGQTWFALEMVIQSDGNVLIYLIR